MARPCATFCCRATSSPVMSAGRPRSSSVRSVPCDCAWVNVPCARPASVAAFGAMLPSVTPPSTRWRVSAAAAANRSLGFSAASAASPATPCVALASEPRWKSPGNAPSSSRRCVFSSVPPRLARVSALRSRNSPRPRPARSAPSLVPLTSPICSRASSRPTSPSVPPGARPVVMESSM